MNHSALNIVNKKINRKLGLYFCNSVGTNKIAWRLEFPKMT